MTKTALITGGTKGIGWALARQLAARDYKLILVARNQQQLNQCSKKIDTEFGTGCTAIQQDLSKTEAAQRLFERVHNMNETVDILINNAGFGGAGRFDQQSLDTQKKMVHLNVNTLMELSYLFLGPMIQRNQGKIMNVASTAAFQPGPGMALYYATKSFVLSLSEAIDLELEDYNVSVTTLCPGPTSTEFHERAGTSGRIINSPLLSMTPERVARIGISGMQRGKSLIIPGYLNKAGTLAARILPRKLIKKIVQFLH